MAYDRSPMKPIGVIMIAGLSLGTISPIVSTAATLEEVAHCRAIENAAQRLSCFKSLKPGPKANTGDAAAAKTERAASENSEGRSLVKRQEAAATHVSDVGRVKTKSSVAAKSEQSAPMELESAAPMQMQHAPPQMQEAAPARIKQASPAARVGTSPERKPAVSAKMKQAERDQPTKTQMEHAASIQMELTTPTQPEEVAPTKMQLTPLKEELPAPVQTEPPELNALEKTEPPASVKTEQTAPAQTEKVAPAHAGLASPAQTEQTAPAPTEQVAPAQAGPAAPAQTEKAKSAKTEQRIQTKTGEAASPPMTGDPAAASSIDRSSVAGQPLCTDPNSLTTMIVAGLHTSNPKIATAIDCEYLAEDAKLTRLERYPSVFPFMQIVRVKVTSPAQPDLTFGFTIEMGH